MGRQQTSTSKSFLQAQRIPSMQCTPQRPTYSAILSIPACDSCCLPSCILSFLGSSQLPTSELPSIRCCSSPSSNTVVSCLCGSGNVNTGFSLRIPMRFWMRLGRTSCHFLVDSGPYRLVIRFPFCKLEASSLLIRTSDLRTLKFEYDIQNGYFGQHYPTRYRELLRSPAGGELGAGIFARPLKLPRNHYPKPAWPTAPPRFRFHHPPLSADTVMPAHRRDIFRQNSRCHEWKNKARTPNPRHPSCIPHACGYPLCRPSPPLEGRAT